MAPSYSSFYTPLETAEVLKICFYLKMFKTAFQMVVSTPVCVFWIHSQPLFCFFFFFNTWVILVESPISWVHEKMKEEQELFGAHWPAYEREKPAPCILLFFHGWLQTTQVESRQALLRLCPLYHLTTGMFPFHYFLQEGTVCKFNLDELWKKLPLF